MVVPFGISLSDFICGIGLIIDIVQALDKTHGAKAAWQELGRELKGLNVGLECIKKLAFGESQEAEISAVKETVAACETCVDNFLSCNTKFLSLGTTPAKRLSLQSLE